jgi:hypothetical protein
MSIEHILCAVPADIYRRAGSGKLTPSDFDELDGIVESCEEFQELVTNFNLVLGKYLNDVQQNGIESYSLVDHSCAFDQMTRLADHASNLRSAATFCMKKNRAVRRAAKAVQS